MQRVIWWNDAGEKKNHLQIGLELKHPRGRCVHLQ